MDIKINTWLLDIQQCIDEIFVFNSGNTDFLAYKSDLKTKKAIERNIEIIGEAVNRILKVNPDFQIKNAKNIIGTQKELFIVMIISLMKLFGLLFRENYLI